MTSEEKIALKNRRIYILDELKSDHVIQFVELSTYLLAKSNEPIKVMIHSNGGDVDCESALVDQIIGLKKKVEVWTIALGNAYSAAATILVMGTKGKRFVRPQSNVMLHPCSYSIDSDYADQQQKLAKFMAKREAESVKLIAEVCGFDKVKTKKFMKDVKDGLWLNAKDALTYGIVDEIITEL